MKKIAFLIQIFLFLLLLSIGFAVFQSQSQNEQGSWENIELVNIHQDLTFSHPVLIDYNPFGSISDGVFDLISGRESGGLIYQENSAENNSQFVFQLHESQLFTTNFDNSAPFVVDLNYDGLEDLLVGDQNGNVHFLVRSEDGSNFDENFNYTSTISVESSAKPAAFYLDDDDLLDIIVGDEDGDITAFINTGNATNPIWDRREDAFNIPLGQFISPFPIDPDSDGNYDLIVGSETQGISYLINRGIQDNGLPDWEPILYSQDENPFRDLNIDDKRHLTPFLADIDEDGFHDLLLGSESGEIRLFHNNGIDFTSLEPSLFTFEFFIISFLIIVTVIIITAYLVNKRAGEEGIPLYLLLVHSAGPTPYKYIFREEMVDDINLAGGAFTGIQSIVSEVTSSDLKAMEAGDNTIMITREEFPNLDGGIQILLWMTEEDEKLRDISKKLANFIVHNFEQDFKKSSYGDEFDQRMDQAISIYFEKWL